MPHKRWSLKRRLFAAISLLVMCSILLISSLTYSRYTEDFSEKSSKQIQQLIEQLAINTDTYINELFRLCLSPYYREDVMKQLAHTPSNNQEKLEKKRVIEGFLREVMTIPRNDILRVYILTDDIYDSTKTLHSLDFSSSSFKDKPWYEEAVSTNETVFIPVYTEEHGGYNQSIFSVVQNLKSLKDTNRVLGVIRVDANYAGIEDVCDKVSIMENSALFIVDSSNNMIYKNSHLPADVSVERISDLAHSITNTYLTTELNGKTYIINSQKITSTDWTIIAVNSFNDLTKDIAMTRNYTLLLTVLCSAVGAAIAVIFVRRFLGPLYKTVDLMRCVQSGDLSVRADTSSADEIAYLNESFNEMLSRIQTMIERDTRLTKQVYEAKYLQKEAQYDALYNQIRPHFLFNTLNTISLLIKCKRDTEAIKSIEELSVMLRGMINTDKDITLAAEMKIVESYLSLQKRRRDSLSYSIELEPALREYMLPALTVQPIVENAYIHGCDPKGDPAVIRISTFSDDEYLYIRVEDNGIGIEKEQLDTIVQNLQNSEDIAEPQTSLGIGLVNISKRIKLKFGDEYGLQISSEPSKGTVVTVSLPSERRL
jgi:two-component system sensor histidine kinase YesM